MSDVYANDLGGLNSPFGVLPAVHRRLQRPVQGGRRPRRAPGRRDQQDADRRLPRLRPAGGQLRLRAARWTGWPGASIMDPVELRARNMVQPEEFPWVNPTGAVYDSGDYERCLRMAADAVDYDRSTGGRVTARHRTVATGASASPATSSAPATPARSSWPGAARSSARTRASPCGRTESGEHRPVHRRVEHRTGQRDRVRPDVRRLLRDRLRRRQRARGRHRVVAPQHGRLRLPHRHRGRRGPAGRLRAAARRRPSRSPPSCSRWTTRRTSRSRAPRSATARTRRSVRHSPTCSTGPSSGRACRPAMPPGLDETAYFEPAGGGLLLWHRRGRGLRRRRDRRVRGRAARDGPRLRAPRSTPSSSRARCGAGSPRGSAALSARSSATTPRPANS